MSLPSKARFKKGDDVIQTIFINCGWYTEGEQTAVDMIQEMYKQGKSFPSSYDTVDIYENKLTKEEVDYILTLSLDLGIICKPNEHDWDTSTQLCSNPPLYKCKKCGETIHCHLI